MHLIHWEAIEQMKTIPDGSIDAIITDPPYWSTACRWDHVIPFEPMWEQLKRIIKPNGAIVLFGSEPFSSALRMSNIKQYKYDWVWKKSKTSNPFLAKYQPMRNYENILVFCKWKTVYNPIMEFVGIKDKRKSLNPFIQKEWSIFWNWSAVRKRDDGYRFPNQVLEFWNSDKTKSLHPTQKPVALLEYLIKTYTNEWETVLDFTFGSGTTAIACLNTNRNFIGIEKDEKYFEIAQNRINNI